MNILRCGGRIPRVLQSRQPQHVLRIQYPIPPHRAFHACPSLWGIKSQLLKDVGEGELQGLVSRLAIVPSQLSADL